MPTLEPSSGTGKGRVTEHGLTINALHRTYLVYRPDTLLPGASLVFAFHPSQGSAKDMRRYVGTPLEAITREDNAVVVYPDGYRGHFNDCRRAADYPARRLKVDDVAFTKAVIQHLVQSDAIDPAHVFAIGFSNGGQMALRLAVEAPDLVAGAAAFAANLPAADNLDCVVAAQLVPRVLLVAGTADPINPYDGGRVSVFGFGDRGDVLSAEQSANWFAERLGLRPTAEYELEQQDELKAVAHDWQSDDGHVRLVTIEGGGHTIPQRGFVFSPWLGPTLRSDAVIEAMWTQFSRGSRTAE